MSQITKEGPFTVETDDSFPGKQYVTKTAKVRLIALPRQYYKHFHPLEFISPTLDDDTRMPIDPMMERGFCPSRRLAIWVFDRLDNNNLTIMDFLRAGDEEIDFGDCDDDCDCKCHIPARTAKADRRLFEHFSYYKEDTGIEPGGASGPDWDIRINHIQYLKKDGSPASRRKHVEIAIPSDKPAPFTPAEIELIKSRHLRDELEEARRAKTREEIFAMMKEKGIK